MSGTLGQVQEAEIVLGALQQLQDAVLATSMAEAGNHDVGNKLSQLSVHLQALLQRHAVFEQSCSDRFGDNSKPSLGFPYPVMSSGCCHFDYRDSW